VLGILSPLAGTYATALGARAMLLLAPDLAGALGVSQDAASWIVSAYAMAEMLAIPVAVYLALAFSMRTVMVTAAAAFTTLSVAAACADGYVEMLAVRAAIGLVGGFFSPLSFTMVLRTFSNRGRHEGLAALGFAVIASIPAAGLVAGFALGQGHLPIVHWVQAALGLLVLTMAWIGIPRQDRDPGLLRRLDWPGYALFAIGFPALLLVLTQGERQFWLESPTIVAGSAVAALAIGMLALRELALERPLVDYSILWRLPHFGGVMLLNLFFRFGMLATAFVGAQFLARVQGWSLVELARVLPWAALPQLVSFPLVYMVAKRIDPRFTLTGGLMLFALAAWINANLSAEWATQQYCLSLLVLAFAEPLFMVSMTYEGVYGIQPHEGPSATTLFNITRSVGDAGGVAVLATVITEREKLHSSVLVEHVSAMTGPVLERFEALRDRFAALHADDDRAAAQALHVLAEQVRIEAYVAAYNDAFLAVAGALTLAVLISLLLPKVPDITAGIAPGAKPARGRA